MWQIQVFLNFLEFFFNMFNPQLAESTDAKLTDTTSQLYTYTSLQASTIQNLERGKIPNARYQLSLVINVP